jgi:hypothetical protein
MRRLIALLVVVSASVASTEVLAARDGVSTDTVLRWINNYRAKPDPARVPDAIHALNRLGVFAEPEKAAVYVGFLAGVIAANPDTAEKLIGKILPLPDEAQWVVVRAVAYSGVPEWQAMLTRLSGRLPARQVMIEKFIGGKLPRLDDFALERDPAWYEKVQESVRIQKYFEPTPPPEVKLANTPELLDTLWGFYFATGASKPVLRITRYLQWAKDRDSADRLTLGSMAKYTLVNNASRDTSLLVILKYASRHEPEPLRPLIREVVDAAETVETSRVKKEALAAIEELQRKGPGAKRDMAWWGYVGEGAIAVGCVAAAAVGTVALGLPCVVGGATTSYALRTWLNSQ